MPTSRNRTKWPINGGAIAIQPGWFSGHATAFFYINMGYGNEPLNMSHPMVPVFQITGPANTMYKGAFCLPQVPLPANASFKVGDNATIQVVETAVHGAALYNVSSPLGNLHKCENVRPLTSDSALISPLPNLRTLPKSTRPTAKIRQNPTS